MKKIIMKIATAFCMVAITSTAANAQMMKLGPKAGVNFSRIYQAPESVRPDNQSMKFGAQGGWVFNWTLSDMVSIQQEVLFMQKGDKIEHKTYDTTANLVFEDEYEEALTLNYIDLPLLLRFSFGDPTDKQFFINFGPRVGFLVGGNIAWNNTKKQVVPEDNTFEKEETQGQSEINENAYENAEFGFDMGLGYDINTGPGHFIIDLRWGMGLSDIRFEGLYPVKSYRAKNQSASISLIYLFGNEK